MSYHNPIEVIQTQMRNQIEGEIYKAVMKVGVNVDKEELLKALQYDREQYQKGYKDRDDQIVRCKDCKHFNVHAIEVHGMDRGECDHGIADFVPPDWYCADGERKD